jgi:hypothetical protein
VIAVARATARVPREAVGGSSRCRAGLAGGGGEFSDRPLYTRIVDPLEHLVGVDLAGWRRLHRRAVAVGCGVVLAIDSECIAATDQLLALALVELVGLGPLAGCVDAARELDAPDLELCVRLGEAAAGVVRLLDRALAAHGRDCGYTVAAWRDRAVQTAHVIATTRPDDAPAPGSAFELVGWAAVGAADAVTALPRDRMSVPEALSDALAYVLAVYAAASGPDRAR